MKVWIYLAHDKVQLRALVITITNIRVAQNAGNSLTTWATISFLTRALQRSPGLLHLLRYEPRPWPWAGDHGQCWVKGLAVGWRTANLTTALVAMATRHAPCWKHCPRPQQLTVPFWRRNVIQTRIVTTTNPIFNSNSHSRRNNNNAKTYASKLASFRLNLNFILFLRKRKVNHSV